MIQFQTGKFNGPLDLLLSLIEKEELDITEVSLAKIADEYIAYLKNSAKIDPEQVADFLVVAARLLYIKSKALLPYLATPEEDEEVQELERRLKMYREFQEASRHLEKRLAKKQFLFIRDYSSSGRKRFWLLDKKFSPPQGVSKERLQEQFEYLLGRLQKEEQVLQEEKMEYKISIEERIIGIQQILLEKISFNFSHLVAAAKSKTEIIVNFLALLELAKQRELGFSQLDLFGEIEVNKL